MGFFRFLTVAVISLAASNLLAASTSLEKTPVRQKASVVSSKVADLPAGTSYSVVTEEGMFTKIKAKMGSKTIEGFVLTAQLSAGSNDATKSMGKSVAKGTGYSKSDIAAAVQMGIPPGDSQRMMKAKPTKIDAGAAKEEMDDEFEGLPEDAPGDESGDALAVGNDAIDMAAKNDEDLKKKKAEADKTARQVKAANNLRKTIDGTTTDEVDKQNSVIDAVDESGMLGGLGGAGGGGESSSPASALAGGGGGSKTKTPSAPTMGDMSSVEALEAVNFSKADFTSTSPFLTEGHLKSKTLK